MRCTDSDLDKLSKNRRAAAQTCTSKALDERFRRLNYIFVYIHCFNWDLMLNDIKSRHRDVVHLTCKRDSLSKLFTKFSTGIDFICLWRHFIVTQLAPENSSEWYTQTLLSLHKTRCICSRFMNIFVLKISFLS